MNERLDPRYRDRLVAAWPQLTYAGARSIVARAEEVIAVPTGKVKWYDAEKGFGFLSQDEGRTSTCAPRRCPRA